MIVGGPIWNKSINDIEFLNLAWKNLKDPKYPSGYVIEKKEISNLFERIIKVSIFLYFKL